MKTSKLSESDITSRLEKLVGWHVDNGKLYREFVFKDFVEAFGFMTRAAFAVEKINHHPEWSNTYNKVRIHLVTHEVGGLSASDFALAQRLNELGD